MPRRKTLASLLLICCSTALHAQTYEKDWAAIDSLSGKGLAQSAVNLAKTVYVRARTDHRDPEAIRALMDLVRTQEPIVENADSLAIRLWESVADSFAGPARSVVLNLEAQAFRSYLSRNRYRLEDRQPSSGAAGDDFTTWAIPDYTHRIDSLFSASLSDTVQLGATALDGFAPIMQPGNSRFLRPSLLDFLADRAVRYYIGEGPRPMSLPTDTFLLAPADVFMIHPFTGSDTTLPVWKAVRLYQLLLRFHAHDPHPDALVDADIARLHLIHGLYEQSDSLYVCALQNLTGRYAHQVAGAAASFAIADNLAGKGASYNPSEMDTLYRWTRRQALDTLDAIIRDFPGSFPAGDAVLLAREIRRSNLDIQTESVCAPGQPFLASVSFTNAPRIHLRIIRDIPDADEKTLRAAKTLRGWTQPLPDPGDYQNHRTEIAIQALPPGSYILLAALNARFGTDSLPLQATEFQVSSIGWLMAGERDAFVLNRETGEPIAGARVRARFKSGVRELLSDNDGHVPLQPVAPYANYSDIHIYYRDDSVTVSGVDYPDPLRKYHQSSAPQFTFITDRAIYRPGQTVYFKAIGTLNEGDTVKPLRQGTPVTVYLERFQLKLDSLRLRMNEFSSANGRFQLPSALPTGNYEIAAGSGSGSFSISVEEYKRARFNVRLDRPKGNYRLGDTVALHGNAQAYAGNAIDGAKVSYTVTRSAYPRMFVRFPNHETILHDTVRTDAAGDFSIRVPLIPGQVNSATFNIQADVTDRNGETHSADFSLEANRSALNLAIVLPDSPLLSDSLHTLDVEATNLAGVARDVRAKLIISRLKAPDRWTRDRAWEDPDVFAIPEDTFHRKFPLDPYGKQTDKSDWPVQERILQDSLTTGTPFTLAQTRLASGIYRIEVSALDTFGERAGAKEILEVFDPHTGQMPYPAYSWACPGGYVPGDSVAYYVGSSAGPRFTVQQSTADPRVFLRTARLPGQVAVLHYPAFRRGRSATAVGAAFFADNRAFTHDDVIPARPTDDSLRLRYATFRDHLEPGTTERLTLSVRGPDGKAVDAEIAASLYDASLDQFVRSPWRLPELDLSSGAAVKWNAADFDASSGETKNYPYAHSPAVALKKYDELYDRSATIRIYGMRSMVSATRNKVLFAMPAAKMADTDMKMALEQDERQPAESSAEPPPIPDIRKNFNETAFFYPALRTARDGSLSYTFTMPDALTRWTLQTLAHTRDLAFGLDSRGLVTQKTLMLQPNVPRFLREGDDAWLSTKVVSMAHAPLQGTVRLEILDALTMKIAGIAGGAQNFSLAPGAAGVLRFRLDIPPGYTQPLVYRLTAVAGSYSDGEQGPIPVLSRRILVTETYPLQLDGAAPYKVDVDPLLAAARGTPYRLTLEYAASPAWYALMALPYLEPASDACPQFALDRFYTDALGAGIVKALPSARDAIAKAAAAPSEQSALDRDPELKNSLLQETPWILDAKDERASIKALSRFLDNTSLRSDELQAFLKLQSPSGGFPWFTGGPDSRYATQYIVEHIGKLSALGMLSGGDRQSLHDPIRKMLAWLDKALVKDAKDSLRPEEDLQYPYVRSFFKDVPANPGAQSALDYYLALGKHDWMDYSLMGQARIALACHRAGDDATAGLILTSLRQRSLYTPALGRYWKMEDCWYWYQAPIETQSMLLSAFVEIAKDSTVADQLRTWLLGQKQTHAWASRSATVDACYALLLGGRDWLDATPTLTARLGDVTVTPEATAGYVKTQWENPKPSMGRITLRRTGNTNHRSWGAVYYQHFQDLDSVTAAQTTLAVRKELFVVPPTGNLLRPLRDGDTLHLGDRVRIRLVLRSDRPLDFVQLKDLRPACFEPVEALSGYRWQGGLGYYFSPGDLSTSFYLDHLPRGTYVLEYDQYVNMAGGFAAGPATLQSLYAPQFAARTAGLTLRVLP